MQAMNQPTVSWRNICYVTEKLLHAYMRWEYQAWIRKIWVKRSSPVAFILHHKLYSNDQMHENVPRVFFIFFCTHLNPFQFQYSFFLPLLHPQTSIPSSLSLGKYFSVGSCSARSWQEPVWGGLLTLSHTVQWASSTRRGQATHTELLHHRALFLSYLYTNVLQIISIEGDAAGVRDKERSRRLRDTVTVSQICEHKHTLHLKPLSALKGWINIFAILCLAKTWMQPRLDFAWQHLVVWCGKRQAEHKIMWVRL